MGVHHSSPRKLIQQVLASATDGCATSGTGPAFSVPQFPPQRNLYHLFLLSGNDKVVEKEEKENIPVEAGTPHSEERPPLSKSFLLENVILPLLKMLKPFPGGARGLPGPASAGPEFPAPPGPLCSEALPASPPLDAALALGATPWHTAGASWGLRGLPE